MFSVAFQTSPSIREWKALSFLYLFLQIQPLDFLHRLLEAVLEAYTLLTILQTWHAVYLSIPILFPLPGVPFTHDQPGNLPFILQDPLYEPFYDTCHKHKWLFSPWVFPILCSDHVYLLSITMFYLYVDPQGLTLFLLNNS